MNRFILGSTSSYEKEQNIIVVLLFSNKATTNTVT